VLKPRDVDATTIGLLARFVARCLGDVQDAWLLGGYLPSVQSPTLMSSQFRGRCLV